MNEEKTVQSGLTGEEMRAYRELTDRFLRAKEMYKPEKSEPFVFSEWRLATEKIAPALLTQAERSQPQAEQIREVVRKTLDKASWSEDLLAEVLLYVAAVESERDAAARDWDAHIAEIAQLKEAAERSPSFEGLREMLTQIAGLKTLVKEAQNETTRLYRDHADWQPAQKEEARLTVELIKAKEAVLAALPALIGPAESKPAGDSQALRERVGWQPMETAPKGPDFAWLAYIDGSRGPRVGKCKWHGVNWYDYETLAYVGVGAAYAWRPIEIVPAAPDPTLFVRERTEEEG